LESTPSLKKQNATSPFGDCPPHSCGQPQLSEISRRSGIFFAPESISEPLVLQQFDNPSSQTINKELFLVDDQLADSIQTDKFVM
jgi:hypothetical protein